MLFGIFFSLGVALLQLGSICLLCGLFLNVIILNLNNLRRVKMTSIRIIPVVTCIVSAISLAGCGGGTTGPLIAPPIDDPIPAPPPPAPAPPSPAPPATIESYLAPESVKVRVGIVDSGVRVNHFRIADSIAETHISSDATSIVDDIVHGTPVAQIIADNTRNERLFVSKATSRAGQLSFIDIFESTQWLNTRGVRVINYSLSPLYFFSPLFQENRLHDTVSVISAGNHMLTPPNVGNITVAIGTNPSAFDVAGLMDNTLIVGALDLNNNLASYSYIPGGRTDVQNRFLVANAPATVHDVNSTRENPITGLFYGTSATAPVVTAAVVNLLARWPALTGKQVTDLILNNTDRSFTNLYSVNSCGVSQNLNCGLYNFGQGKLDMFAAIRPLGPVSVAMSSTVEGPSVAFVDSSIVLPLAFGDAARNLNVSTAVFDSIGRDYQVDIKHIVNNQKATNITQVFSNKIHQQHQNYSSPNVNMSLGFSGGVMKYSNFNFKSNNLSLSFAQNNNIQNTVDTSIGNFLSFNSNSILENYHNMNQFGFGLNVAPTVKFYVKTTRASLDTNNTSITPSAANQQEIGIDLNVSQNSTLTVGYRVTRENNSMLGLVGRGALNLNGSTNSALRLHLVNQHGNGWSSFGMVQKGTKETYGNGLLSSISDARTSEFAGGLSWQGQNQRFSFLVAQPLRVDSAKANFNVATGRTINGDVMRSNVVAHLQPSGRHINFEASFEQQLGKNHSFNLHTIYARDQGHVSGNNNLFIGGIYRASW